MTNAAGYLLFIVFFGCIGLVILNVVCWLLLCHFPGFFFPRKQRIAYDPIAVIGLYFKGQAYKWFGLSTQEEFDAFLKERRASNNFSLEYEPCTEFRHAPFNSTYINISPHGFRHVENQGPWPPDRDNCNIFVFGGSNMFSWGMDTTTVASFLQKSLDGCLDRLVRVYNFGRGSYFSTQEKMLFFRLLEQGQRPDYAIFFHGLNEFMRFDGTPITSRIYREALRRHYASVNEHDKAMGQGAVRWFRLWMFMRSLPLFTASASLWRRLSGIRDDAPPSFMEYTPLSSAQVDAIVDRCLNNHRQIIAVSHAHGITPTIVIQPHPTYKYDIACHKALIPGLGFMGNERAGDGYPALLEAVHHAEFYGNSLLDLSGVQEGRKENLYMDEVHYTADFSRELARMVADALISGNGRT